MFLRTKVETNYVSISSKVRLWYSVIFTRFGEVRKFCCFENWNLIEKSSVVETWFMYSKLSICVWWLTLYVCFGEIIRFGRVSDDSGKKQQVCNFENSGFCKCKSISIWLQSIAQPLKCNFFVSDTVQIDCCLVQIDCTALKMWFLALEQQAIDCCLVQIDYSLCAKILKTVSIVSFKP